MKLTLEQLDGLVKLIGLTKDTEINCNQCLDRIAEFAEFKLADKEFGEALVAVEHHLALCTECREEYEALRRALGGMSQDRGET